jgi:hypothetical protein
MVNYLQCEFLAVNFIRALGLSREAWERHMADSQYEQLDGVCLNHWSKAKLEFILMINSSGSLMLPEITANLLVFAREARRSAIFA